MGELMGHMVLSFSEFSGWKDMMTPFFGINFHSQFTKKGGVYSKITIGTFLFWVMGIKRNEVI